MYANQFLGELGMIEQAARSATAVALEDGTRAAVIHRDDLERLYQDDPAKAVLVLQHLARRLNHVEQRTTEGEGNDE